MNAGLDVRYLHVSDFFQKGAHLMGRLIAYDAMDGKLLFDTEKNKAVYIQGFYNGIVSAMWGGIVQKKDKYTYPHAERTTPAICIYVDHNSWYEGAYAE